MLNEIEKLENEIVKVEYELKYGTFSNQSEVDELELRLERLKAFYTIF